jgi:hypothetical protein
LPLRKYFKILEFKQLSLNFFIIYYENIYLNQDKLIFINLIIIFNYFNKIKFILPKNFYRNFLLYNLLIYVFKGLIIYIYFLQLERNKKANFSFFFLIKLIFYFCKNIFNFENL